MTKSIANKDISSTQLYRDRNTFGYSCLLFTKTKNSGIIEISMNKFAKENDHV